MHTQYKILTLFIGIFALFSCLSNQNSDKKSEFSDTQTLEKVEKLGFYICGHNIKKLNININNIAIFIKIITKSAGCQIYI